ncbi:MAG: solute carrier family 25 carnitine/acylcarnitine transporter 20/29 [Bacillariaceae sp.]|jgi:solute carrier family 25 carnitine/acylcarnitine transporter 20/29
MKSVNLGEEAIGGLSAGILGTLIGFPLDLIKTRLQTGSSSLGQRQSILSIGKGIVRSEGIGALYIGIGPPLISLSILNTTTFIQYAYFRELYQANPGWDLRNFLAGVSCAPFAGIVSTIENFTKTQMQLDNIKQPKREFTGSWNCFTTLIRQHGLGIIYTGHFVNTVREISFIGPYFFLYEGLRETFIRKQQELKRQENFQQQTYPSFISNVKFAIPVAGGLSGAMSWLISFPLDCIRAGVQGQRMPPNKNAFQICRELILTRGIRGLYAGSSASIARAFLVSGSRFSAYEGALYLLRGGRNYEKHRD